MDCLPINKYIQFILLVLLCYIMYRIYKSYPMAKENFESNCCPPDDRQFVYDCNHKPKCYNKRNYNTNPLPNCLPANFLDTQFTLPNEPQDYV